MRPRRLDPHKAVTHWINTDLETAFRRAVLERKLAGDTGYSLSQAWEEAAKLWLAQPPQNHKVSR